jgi:HEAT repeat protein
LRCLGRIKPEAGEVIEVLASTGNEDMDKNLRVEALKALAGFGTRASRALPALLRALKDPEKDVRVQALRSLPAFGPLAPTTVKTLALTMQTDELGVYQEAVKALNTMRPKPLETKDYGRYLVGAFRNEHDEVCQEIVKDLKKEGKDIIYSLSTQVDHPVPRIREWALAALAEMGPEASTALPTLQRRALAEQDPQKRQQIIETMQKIQGK